MAVAVSSEQQADSFLRSQQYHVFDAAMPFGGYKESGWGREMRSAVLNNHLETKSVVTAL